MRLVHRRVAVQPRAGHDPIDEVVDHRGDVIDANEAVVQRRGLVGLHCTPGPRRPTRRSPPHPLDAEGSAAVRGRRQPSLVSAAGRVNPVVTVVPGSDTQDLSADGDL
jgi:hypothetical protein